MPYFCRVKRNAVIFVSLTLLLVLLSGLDICVGSSWLFPWGDMSEIEKHILLTLRLPKMLTAIMAGMALSVSGLMMQTLFRNPLAGP